MMDRCLVTVVIVVLLVEVAAEIVVASSTICHIQYTQNITKVNLKEIIKYQRIPKKSQNLFHRRKRFRNYKSDSAEH